MAEPFTQLCELAHKHIDQYPTATDFDLVTRLITDLDCDATQATRAIGTVRRARAATAAEREGGRIIGSIGADTVPEAFSAAYARVCRAVDHRIDQHQRREFYELLRDLPLEVLTDVAVRLAQTSGTWPRVNDWRKMAASIQSARAPRQELLPETRVNEQGETESVYRCGVCNDLGWRPECGCRVGELVAGFCERHPRVEFAVSYRPRYQRCECVARRLA